MPWPFLFLMAEERFKLEEEFGMRIAVLHISDIHFNDRSNPVADRIEQITSAFRSIGSPPDSCLVAVTGDIAYSGSASQYEVASAFFRLLEVSLKAVSPKMDVWFTFAPGNHDCDHSDNSDLRQIAIDGISTKIDEIDANGAAVKELLLVHRHFFEFRSKFATDHRGADPWLVISETFSRPGSASVKVVCLNTAFMSQKHEQQGKLCFPVQALRNEKADGANLMVTLMHHPYDWLESNNGLAVRKCVERMSDLILTGHVHVESAHAKINISGEQMQYVAGGVLQDQEDKSASAFNIILCDLDLKLQRVFQFTWDQRIFRSKNEPLWSPFVRNATARNEFDVNPQYADILRDTGLGLTHPRKKRLELDDLFVYPDLTRSSITRPQESSEIKSEGVVGYVARTERLIILGSAQAGKSAFARRLYRDLLDQHSFVPILISANEIRATNEAAFLHAVYQAFREQYSEATLEDFRQLDRNRKVLIVDDWHKAKANPKWRASVLSLALTLFGKVVLFANDEIRMEEFVSTRQDSDPILGFDRCEIRQFGHVLRAKLIEKWHSLDAPESDYDLTATVEQDESIIASMVVRKILPCFPATVLLVLQAREASKAANLVNGSYGYLYEALITRALAKVGGDAAEIDTRYTFISRIAHYLFIKGQTLITEDEVQRISDDYFSSYEISVSVQRLVRDLEDANIFARSDGNLSFRYRYIFYYFVARYFQENLRNADEQQALRSKLGDMADRATSEDYANILMFVIYLTKDTELIDHILQNARRVFAEFEPCDFVNDIRFLNELSSAPKVVLPSTSVAQHREERRKMLDEFDSSHEDEADDVSEAISYSDDMNPVLKTGFALRTLELMGQVLRNFPGSLRKEIKLEIARASYLLGLRILHAFLDMMETNLDEVRSFLSEGIMLNEKSVTPEEAINAANKAIFFLARLSGFGLVKRVTYTVGARILERTYKSVLDAEGNTVPISLIDLSVRLDHLSFPENEIRRLWANVKDNAYASTMIRDLVASHFYLHEVENRRRQSIEALLDIKTQPLTLPSATENREFPTNKKRKRRKRH